MGERRELTPEQQALVAKANEMLEESYRALRDAGVFTSPMPVGRVKWIHSDQVQANDYNDMPEVIALKGERFVEVGMVVGALGRGGQHRTGPQQTQPGPADSDVHDLRSNTEGSRPGALGTRRSRARALHLYRTELGAQACVAHRCRRYGECSQDGRITDPLRRDEAQTVGIGSGMDRFARAGCGRIR